MIIACRLLRVKGLHPQTSRKQGTSRKQATVTFATGFTMPGGYDRNPGPNQGMETLTRETAFKAFALIKTIAMILSTSVVVIYFLGGSI
ncbi:hypothetical protein ACSBR1_013430 [Camellia fascicularis]